MSSSNLRSIFTILFLVSSSLQCFSRSLLAPEPNNGTIGKIDSDSYTVYIINKIPPNPFLLKLHCFSGNNDLGVHTLSQNQNFHWSFNENVGFTTEFFCHFWWNKFDKGFSAFNHHFAVTYCKSHRCFWIADQTGFSITDDLVFGTPIRMFTW